MRRLTQVPSGRTSGTPAARVAVAGAPADFAYAPLVGELERRLVMRGIAVPPATASAQSSATRKRELLRLGARHLGPGFAAEIGKAVAAYTGHPFVRALVLAPGPAELMARWQRLEILAHSENRVHVTARQPTSIRLVRVRRRGGAPTIDEDRFVVALLVEMLAAAGAVKPSARVAGHSAAGRTWHLRWRDWKTPSAAGVMATPGHANDFARAAFALLLGDAGLGLVDLARQLAVSPRTLQRRLASAGTTMQALVRSARVALAGDALVRNATGHVSLTTVALACGFADSAHLSREFRHLVAMQPSAFARSIAVPPRAERRRLAR